MASDEPLPTVGIDLGAAPPVRGAWRRYPLPICAVLLLWLVPMLWQQASAERPRSHRRELLARVLVADPSAWRLGLAQEFVDGLPAKIFEPLSAQTAKTIPYFAIRSPMPRASFNDPMQFACWASSGSGGGYMAIVRRYRGQHTRIWDTLMPPSFITPRIEYQDVDGDSLPEIICSGKRLDGGVSEWAIVHWDGTEGRLLAPRLDYPGRSHFYHRLIGKSLRFEHSPGESAMKLLLTIDAPTPSDSSLSIDSTTTIRVFEYIDSIGGFLPSP